MVTSYEPQGTTTEYYSFQVEARHQNSCSSVNLAKHVLFWHFAVLENELACVATYAKRQT